VRNCQPLLTRFLPGSHSRRELNGWNLKNTGVAVEHLMLTNAVHDCSEFRPSIELWTQAVKASGYVEATLSEIAPDEHH